MSKVEKLFTAVEFNGKAFISGASINRLLEIRDNRTSCDWLEDEIIINRMVLRDGEDIIDLRGGKNDPYISVYAAKDIVAMSKSANKDRLYVYLMEFEKEMRNKSDLEKEEKKGIKNISKYAI